MVHRLTSVPAVDRQRIKKELFIFGYFLLTGTGRWSVYDVPTDVVRPSYGHSSAYNPDRGLIYIHGGFFEGEQTNDLTTALTSYDPTARTW